MKPSYGSVLQMPLRQSCQTTVIDLQLNKLQSGTHRRPAQELSDSLCSWPVFTVQICCCCPFSACDRLTKSQLWCSKQSCPGTVAIQSLLIILGLSHSALAVKLEKSHPHFNIQNIFNFVEEAFLIFQKCELLPDLVTREQTRAH